MGGFSPKMRVKLPNMKQVVMNQIYILVIQGQLVPQWSAIFEGMQVACLPDGNTRITGCLPDQSALYGLLMRLRDLGIKLVSVNVVDPKEKK